MSKYFLITCVALMVAAGTYGAADMSRDLSNNDLINYETVDYRHAKAILFIIKTTGLGTDDFIGVDKSETSTRKERKEIETHDKNQVEEYFEEFSRGDCKRC